MMKAVLPPWLLPSVMVQRTQTPVLPQLICTASVPRPTLEPVQQHRRPLACSPLPSRPSVGLEFNHLFGFGVLD